ncbi:biotin/lipoyl-binding protein [Sulfurimonas sp. SAG-AH-194-L11]|nr:biotin/lipoyl-binding protein [Sulfurimonas sp. SAG-AH-194-L11]MDF1876705.1 biotin/lipoyl-binding protein [Sulfurimonas sp. SAG-AH-194-L11]
MNNFKSLELVQQHPIVKRFALITFAILIVFILLLFLPWQQTIYGTGTLTALNPVQRDYKISATIDGFIEEFYVKENQKVKKGDKLFRMVDLDSQYQNSLRSIKEKSIRKYDNEVSKLENLKENLQSIKKINTITLEIYDKQIIQIKNTLQALQEQKIAISNILDIEYINYKRSKSLHMDGIESKRDLELKYSLYLQTKAKFKKIDADIRNKTNELAITIQKKENFKNENSLKINSLKNDILLTKSSIETIGQNIKTNSINISRYDKREIIAKTDGYVVRIYQNDTNRLTKRGENILYFSPIVTKRAIRLKISDFHMPLMKVGLRTRIIFYGWPALQISGWPEIKHGTYPGIVTAIERSTYEKGAYYAIITEDANRSQWPSNEHLKIGTQASVWVRLATVSIWYEIWRLMFALPPNMTLETSNES